MTMLHKLWGQASTHEDYNKGWWTALQGEIENLKQSNALLVGACKDTLGYIDAVQELMSAFITTDESPTLKTLRKTNEAAIAKAEECQG